MIRSYLKIALRNIVKSKGPSAITITGLVFAIVACAMIAQYAVHEMRYDTFQTETQEIYRVAYSVRDANNDSTGYATTFLPIAPALKDEFPEVVDYNRILYLDRHAIVTYQDKIFQQGNIIYADPSFYTFFGYPLLQGNPKLALSEPNSVVISASLAKKYFGNKNPVGQFLKLNEEFNELNLLVTGVQDDIPEYTHLKPQMVVSLKSIETLSATQENAWRWPIYLNYIRLRHRADANLLQSKLAAFAARRVPESPRSSGQSFFLQPFSTIHLHSHLQYEIEENGSAMMVYLLIVVAIIILVVAYTNYVNLTTARLSTRAREIGIRKVMGSRTGQLVRQFLLEGGMINVVSLLLAAILASVLRDFFQILTGVPFDLSFAYSPVFWFAVLSFLITGTLVSSLYPALVLASAKPIVALKGLSEKSTDGFFTRKALVLFQFATTTGLLIATFAIYIQVNHMRTQSPGIDMDPILIVNAPRIIEKQEVKNGGHPDVHEDPYKVMVEKLSGVERVSISSSIPGVWISKSRGIFRSGHEEEKNMTYHTLGVDYDFLNTYDLQLVTGRNFSDDFRSEDEHIVLTERARQQLGFLSPEKALHEKVTIGGAEKEIIGIVRDYHHFSLRESFQPIIFYPEFKQKEFYSIRLTAASMSAVAPLLSTLEKEWKATYPGNPFEYSFLQESYQQQYDTDAKFGTILNIFTVLAIFLACLGLFGLASFTTIKRTKEIGIRKVLGSTSAEIFLLLVKDIIILVFCSGLMAIPFAYVGLSTWLNQFAFSIDLSWWIFTIPLFFILLVALLTVGVQVVKAAIMNPVNSLKNE